MGNNGWVVENLNNALATWNGKLQEIWQLLLTSPEEFRGGSIWGIIVNIHDALKATGFVLLVLFFVMGVVKTTTNFSELKRPEHAVRLFIRFAIAKAMVTYGMDLMLALFRIAQGVVSSIAGSLGSASGMLATLPAEVEATIAQASFWESIPLAAFAGESTTQIGVQFLKSYAGVCLQGAIIVLACVIFTAFAAAPPAVTGSGVVQMVWNYIAELVFNLLVLVGAVKLSERLCKEMLGL